MAISNGTFNEQQRQEQLREMVFNAYSSRIDFFRRLLDPRRDIDEECGYPKQSPAPEVYKDLYDRVAIAARVVEIFPRATWKVQPTVYESEDAEVVTPFELAWDGLVRRLRGEKCWYRGEKGSPIWEYLRRFDIISGIGRYGLLFIGLDDGRPLREPAEQRPGQKITMLRVIPEVLAPINRFESNRNDPRYGLPVSYNITFNDPNSTSVASVTGQSSLTEEVHWTRVVHIADNHHHAGSNEIFAIERLWPVMPHIWDLRKIYGAGGEGYWKSAFAGIALETHPQLGGDVRINRPALQEMMEDYFQSTQRQLILMGMSAKTLAPTVVDPTSHINAQLEAIAIKLECPIRILKGSERGELSSEQDEGDWDDKTESRQNDYATPRVIVPVVDRFIWLGCLPEPGEGFVCDWPPVSKQSASSKATVFGQRMAAMAQYVGGEVSQILPEFDMYTREAGFTEEEAEAILGSAAMAAGVGDVGGDALLEQDEEYPNPEDPFGEEETSGLVTAMEALYNCGGEGGTPGPCPAGGDKGGAAKSFGHPSVDKALSAATTPVDKLKALHASIPQIGDIVLAGGGNQHDAVKSMIDETLSGLPEGGVMSAARELGISQEFKTDGEAAKAIHLKVEGRLGAYVRASMWDTSSRVRKEAKKRIAAVGNEEEVPAETLENFLTENCGGAGSGIPGPCPTPGEMQAKLGEMLSSSDPDRFAKVAKMASDYDKATKAVSRAEKVPAVDTPAMAEAKGKLDGLTAEVDAVFEATPLDADPTGANTVDKLQHLKGQADEAIASLSGKEVVALGKQLGVMRPMKTRKEANENIKAKVLERLYAREGLIR